MIKGGCQANEVWYSLVWYNHTEPYQSVTSQKRWVVCLAFGMVQQKRYFTGDGTHNILYPLRKM